MQEFDLTNPYEIAKFIKQAKKVTPVKAYVQGVIKHTPVDVKVFGTPPFHVLFGDGDDILRILDEIGRAHV